MQTAGTFRSVLSGQELRLNSATPVRRQQTCSSTKAVLSREKRTERDPRPENVGLDAGDAVFVDHTCIDCDTCRWMDPRTFGRVGSQSAVISQPETPEQRRTALHALTACPTFSIHVKKQNGGEMMAAHQDFPLPTVCSNVYHLGYHAENSYGATSWLITRPEGNIMMDSPRFHPGLLKRLKVLGGVKYMMLSHRDDVSDHAKWAEELGFERIIHKVEANAHQRTNECEVQLTGEGGWQLPDGSDDIEIVFTPGHTAGCISVLYKPERAVFTGDHLMYSGRMDRLSIARGVNWYSVDKQLESVRTLLEHDWLHMFPGHGRQRHFTSEEDRALQVNHLLVEEGAAPILTP